MKNLMIFTLTAVFLLIGCGSRSSDKSASPSYSPVSAEEKSATADEYNEKAQDAREEAPGEPIAIEQKMIKEARITIKVKEYETAIGQVKSFVTRQQAYISKEEEFKSDYAIGNRLTIRVPKKNFDTLIADIESVADLIERKNIEAKDVTEEYVDIEARLKTKRQVEERYLELLKQAYSISDVLTVERELKSIREEIESAEGRLKYIDSQVGYSTIYLEINEDLPMVNNFRFFQKLGEGVGVGWKVLLNIILGIVYIWPLLLIGLGTWWLIRRSIRRKRRAKEKVG